LRNPALENPLPVGVGHVQRHGPLTAIDLQDHHPVSVLRDWRDLTIFSAGYLSDPDYVCEEIS